MNEFFKNQEVRAPSDTLNQSKYRMMIDKEAQKTYEDKILLINLASLWFQNV